MAEKLDYQKVRHLLEEADRKWFASHSTSFNYQDHLDFVAKHVAQNYGERSGQRRTGGRGGIR